MSLPWARRAAVAAAVAAAFGSIAVFAETAAAGRSYHVLKCHERSLAADELSQVGESSSYERINQCGPSFQDPKLGIYNDGATGNNAFEQFMYAAPPYTAIRSVCFQHNLRRENHHRAEVLTWPGFDVIAAGGEDAAGWSGWQCQLLNYPQQIVVRLSCAQQGGCPAGPHAHAYVRNLDIELEDFRDPVITNVGGTLLERAWVRSTRSITFDGTDQGGGLAALTAEVNGVQVAQRAGSCHGWPLPLPYTPSLVPCPEPVGELNASRDTAQPPYVNGPNLVRVVATDFAGNEVSQSHTALVDNASPVIAFANSQDMDDPELIRAGLSDTHSGVAATQLYYRRVGGVSWLPLETTIEAGEARARIDSSSLPAGQYEFKAEASDVAGNTAATTLRQNGTPMRLGFPLRFGSRLQTKLGSGGAERQSVPYGTSSTVHGRLLDESGEPLADKEVLVVENFGDGALIRERPTSAITDKDGRFTTRVPAGPSRRILVHFDGTAKYLPAHQSAGTLDVESKASFRTSRDELKEGQRIVFAGKVAHHGARIPAGGKLIELQVRVKTGRWDTVREAFRTDPSGHYRLGYRFGRHYVSDAQFRFRVKVQAEGGWPFEGGTSGQRKVTVRAR